MGYAIGTLTKGGGDDCHYQLLGVIKTLAEANGWVTLRYDTSTANHELILQGEGLSGAEEIFVGFRCYQSAPADIFNIGVAVYTGYIAENSWTSQPSAKYSAFCAHNLLLDYFMQINAQKISVCTKVGTPIYSHAYAGKFFSGQRPGEYPAPLAVGGMFTQGTTLRRFSDLNQQWPYTGRFLGITGDSGSAMYVRDQAGGWDQKYHYPFSNGSSRAYALFGDDDFSDSYTNVPVDDSYLLEQILMQDQNGTSTANIYGWLDGIYAISGFSNASENVVQIGGSSIIDQDGLSALEAVDDILAAGGRAFIVLQNVYRTDFSDFIAMEMI